MSVCVREKEIAVLNNTQKLLFFDFVLNCCIASRKIIASQVQKFMEHLVKLAE